MFLCFIISLTELQGVLVCSLFFFKKIQHCILVSEFSSLEGGHGWNIKCSSHMLYFGVVG